ncbi:DEAD/DEAH box helicase family protein [uncultured Duncaniella sp.]|mgnify:CR=1 FL=1|jgi:type III restriction enzyme|uniref:type III restriction-modification system endonuclease n=1 Tax=Duncaniella dubosii TaxID=2518971 RepID=UPI0025E6E91C|nr:DEAD/DEAH box helicase family protein [uncultured Duncaniella sp.]
MKFKFKIQGYQTNAVENTTAIFIGQPNRDPSKYRRDLGKLPDGTMREMLEDDGYRNADVELSSKQLLENLHSVQTAAGVPLSKSLSKIDGLGAVNLDVEMETGTGKTYVYIKTMFEHNKLYGWSKFIIVVPSIAIREGVAKSFRMLEEHFMEQYGKKARWFVYNSSNLNQLDQFSQDAGLNVMIINTQAFAASLKEGGRSKESRIIYSKRDEFASRRPIDVIAANRPIIIMDEPQKMEGAATQAALKKFNPLFVLNYSATHRTKHDIVYALDALDAYRERLVKRIKVIGFEMKNLRGTSGYMYLDNIILSPNKPPMARISIEVKSASGEPRRLFKTMGVGDSLFVESKELEQYRGFDIAEIFPGSATQPTAYVSFTNGVTLRKGDVVGDSNLLHLQRVQIRETIKAHFEKERQLFKKGIKCLSLFFIDEVAKYRQYDDDNQPVKGVFQQIFEEEYARLVNEEFHIFDEDYNEYLRRFAPYQTHRGYFSIDKKGKMVETKTKRGSDVSEEASDYDLILRDKERLLSFDEPTRFIFSHSALREGWDNPNVFQICTLRHSDSTTAKRQEVGRGLRIAVDRNGVRQDKELLGDEVHNINVLTVIANESYSDFTGALQRETRDALRERAVKATLSYFEGKTITVEGQPHVVTDREASRIMVWLEDNEYIDDAGNITPKYHADVAAEAVAPYGNQLAPMAEGVTLLINSIFDPNLLKEMTGDGNKTKLPEPRLNANFAKPEFQALWNAINRQYVYTVSYDTAELVKNAILHLNTDELKVRTLRYIKIEGQQDAQEVTEFGNTKSTSNELTDVSTSSVKYDLIGQVAKGANITRRTAAKILQGLRPAKLALFRNNPEEFIRKVVQIIREQKATMIVDHIHYHLTDGKYDSDIFTAASRADFDKAVETSKHITDYVVSDSKGERDFAHDLDEAEEVVVYAKLPRSFQIPTPVGNYAPDWAIAMQKGAVKHIFFIAETKGSLQSMQLNAIENAKIDCCTQLFNEISTDNVKYHKVTCYQDLIDAMTSIK